MRRPSRTARRLAGTLAGLALIGATATACGSDDDQDGGSASPGDGTFPLSIENRFGTTEIPEEPERVVTVGYTDQDWVLALGVTPVGVREFGGYDYDTRPWAADQLDGEVIDSVGGEELNLEAIAALEPDLIIGLYSYMDQDTYDSLSDIAPTLAETEDNPDGSTSWQDATLQIGEALGRSDQAQDLVDDVEGQFAEVSAQHPEWADQTLAFDLFLETGHYSLEGTDLRLSAFYGLGFQENEETGELSDELLSPLDKDVLVGVGYTPEEAAAEPVFASLSVVREDRTVYLGAYDTDLWGAIGFSSPLSLPYVLDALVTPLTEAADGDPATVVEQPAA